jgi:hypothetical protein
MKKIVIFLSLLGGHLLLGSILLLFLYCCLGVLLAVWQRREKLLLLMLILSEVVIGIGLMLFKWNNGQLKDLSDNMQLSFGIVAGVQILINLVSALLVTFSSYYVTRLILSFRAGRKKIKAHLQVAMQTKVYETGKDLSTV